MTGLVNSSGTQGVAYTYDARGSPLTTTGTMADTLGSSIPSATVGMSMIPSNERGAQIDKKRENMDFQKWMGRLI